MKRREIIERGRETRAGERERQERKRDQRGRETRERDRERERVGDRVREGV